MPSPAWAGGVAERLKAHAWKACIGETLSRVRIPLPPPARCAPPFAIVRPSPLNPPIKCHFLEKIPLYTFVSIRHNAECHYG